MKQKKQYCTEIQNRYCNKCGNKEKEERKCIKNMHEIDGWW